MNFESFRQLASVPGLVGRVQRFDSVCVQVVLPGSPARLRISLLQHTLDPAGPILARAPFGAWLHFRKICATPLRRTHARSAPAASRDRQFPALPDQLLVGLVHAHDRPTGMVGTGIDFQNVLHAGYECGAAPGRDPLILLPMRLQLVFFSVRCTVITDTRSTQPSSTAFSASRRRVALPPRRGLGAGQGDQASLERAVEDHFPRRPHPPLRSKANSNPCSTNRRFKCSTVRAETPSASATRGHGPSRPFRPAVAQQQRPRVQEPLAGGLGRGPGQGLQFRALFHSERTR